MGILFTTPRTKNKMIYVYPTITEKFNNLIKNYDKKMKRLLIKDRIKDINIPKLKTDQFFIKITTLVELLKMIDALKKRINTYKSEKNILINKLYIYHNIDKIKTKLIQKFMKKVLI